MEDTMRTGAFARTLRTGCAVALLAGCIDATTVFTVPDPGAGGDMTGDEGSTDVDATPDGAPDLSPDSPSPDSGTE